MTTLCNYIYAGDKMNSYIPMASPAAMTGASEIVIEDMETHQAVAHIPIPKMEDQVESTSHDLPHEKELNLGNENQIKLSYKNLARLSSDADKHLRNLSSRQHMMNSKSEEYFNINGNRDNGELELLSHSDIPLGQNKPCYPSMDDCEIFGSHRPIQEHSQAEEEDVKVLHPQNEAQLQMTILCKPLNLNSSSGNVLELDHANETLENQCNLASASCISRDNLGYPGMCDRVPEALPNSHGHDSMFEGRDDHRPEFVTVESGGYSNRSVQPPPRSLEVSTELGRVDCHPPGQTMNSAYHNSENQIPEDGIQYCHSSYYRHISSYPGTEYSSGNTVPFGPVPQDFTHYPDCGDYMMPQMPPGSYRYPDHVPSIIPHTISPTQGSSLGQVNGFYNDPVVTGPCRYDNRGIVNGYGNNLRVGNMPYGMSQYHLPNQQGWPIQPLVHGINGTPVPYGSGGHFLQPHPMMYIDPQFQYNRNWNAIGDESSSHSMDPYYGAYNTRPPGAARESERPHPTTSVHNLSRRTSQRRSVKRSRSVSDAEHEIQPSVEPPMKTKVPRPSEADAVVLPTNIHTLKPRDIVSWYIDYLINENEAITEMSQSFTIPVNIYDTDDVYFLESLDKKISFPSRKFLHWMSAELPSLNPHAIDFFEGHCRPSLATEWTIKNKNKIEIIKYVFFFFQERRACGGDIRPYKC